VPGQVVGFVPIICFLTSLFVIPLILYVTRNNCQNNSTSLNYFGNSHIKQTNLGSKKTVYV